MIRVVLGIVAGVVAALAAVFLTDAVVRALSAGAVMPDTADAAAMRAYMASLPVAALAAFAVGCGVAALVGAGVAAGVARRGAWPGWVVTGVLLAATVANFAMIPHPVWLVVLSLVLAVAAGWWSSRRFGTVKASSPGLRALPA